MVAVNNLPPTVWAFFVLKTRLLKVESFQHPRPGWGIPVLYMPLYSLYMPLYSLYILDFSLHAFIFLYSGFTFHLHSLWVSSSSVYTPFIFLYRHSPYILFIFCIYPVYSLHNLSYSLYAPFTFPSHSFILLTHSLYISPLDSLCIFSYPRLCNVFSNFDIQNNEIPKVIQWFVIVWGHKWWKS